MTDNGFRDVKLNIGLDNQEPYENLFQKGYSMVLHKDFIERREEKKQNIGNHSKRLKYKIKINHEQELSININKWKICYVNFGMNIGTEINGVRPALIYKHDNYKYGEDIIVIPITSYKNEEEKSVDTFDIELDQDLSSGLKNRSLVKVRQIKSISKKRLRKKKHTDKIMIVGKIEDEGLRKSIDNNVRVMLGI